ncbi:MAG: hypothetical protein JWM37_782 [Candidatus Saccharibacteria bacterium]|nr:hypothetical protein [Candidatus Saccharibacteria bacterium]
MIITGHRGARGLAQENTLAAFKAALNHKVDEIEFDIRVTKDGIPVLYHDDVLHPEHGPNKPVRELTYDEIKTGFKEIFTLDEAIRAVDHRAHLLIEIKPDESVEPIVAIVKKHLSTGWTHKEINFASFSFGTLVSLHAALPEITCVVNEGWSSVRVRRRMKALSSTRCSMNQLWLWSFFIWAMSRRGYQVGTYTINNPGKARRWEKAGLYAAITDFPDRFRD